MNFLIGCLSSSFILFVSTLFFLFLSSGGDYTFWRCICMRQSAIDELMFLRDSFAGLIRRLDLPSGVNTIVSLGRDIN